jgi:3'(2'), 5'-bisphosphate nucleotidase
MDEWFKSPPWKGGIRVSVSRVRIPLSPPKNLKLLKSNNSDKNLMFVKRKCFMISQSLLDNVVEIAYQAGAAIMAIYQNEFDVAFKDDQSPLTQADLAAHHLIYDGLTLISPDVPVLSEEDVNSFSGANQEGYYWLVDPLDGTKEFVKKNGEFTVNIALIKDGNPILGVVYAPALEWMYSAANGLGAYKKTGQQTAQSIQVALDAKQPYKVVGSRSHADASLNDWLKRLGEYALIPMGSSLKICLIAEGSADIYPRLGPTSLWDTAAAHAVLNVAGGGIRELTGKPLTYINPSTVLNPYFVAIGSPVLTNYL